MQPPKSERFEEIIKKFTDLAPVLVLGDVGIDKYTYGEVNRISPEAPVPILEVKKEWPKLGLAANISDNLMSLGIQSTLCGVIGEDEKGNTFEDLLEEIGLKTWGLVRERERPTTFKERITTKTQQICRVDYESVGDIDSKIEDKILARVQEFIGEHSALIIENYGKGLLTERLSREVIALCQQKKKFVAVDPSRVTPPHFYKGASLLKPNLTEAKIMCSALGYKNSSLEEMAKVLTGELEVEQIVITLGGEGMALMNASSGKLIKIPTVAKKVFDVSGAGDTAIAVLVISLLAGGTLEEAAWLGNCASGVVVGKSGTATVNLSELRDFYQLLLKELK